MVYMLQKNMKSQMKEANKMNAKYVLIIGDNELESKEVIIKEMFSGEQHNILLDKIIEFFN